MNIPIPKRMQAFTEPSVWLEFSPLAQATQSLNLGQGFPGWAPPQFIIDSSVKKSSSKDFSIYARSSGHLNLTKEISNIYSEKINQDLDPQKNILVTVGATEALYLSIMSFINPQDEVIILEPAFDIYIGALQMAEANIQSVSIDLTSEELEIKWNELELKLSAKTKAIIINSPHNPSGKVFKKEELEKLSLLLKKYPNCLVISDEVYEHLTYDENPHIPIASFEGMFEKTISIYSAGKTFSTTGWKVGWAISSKEIIKQMQLAHQWMVFSVSTLHQEVIADALKIAQNQYNDFNNYFDWLKNNYQEKRDLLYNGLKIKGYNPIKPDGGFFILCNIENKNIDIDLEKKYFQNDLFSDIQTDKSTKDLNDYIYARKLCLSNNVVTIPVSAFYLNENRKNNSSFIRFAFCKEILELEKALTFL